MNPTSNKQEILLSQWQTCVEMANSISQRRDATNSVFITLNLAIIATVSFVWDIKSMFVLIAGIVLCVLWLLFIRNYKLLNKAKYDVINTLEKQLPASPFKDEWDLLQKTKKYHDGTKLEQLLATSFICLYILASIIIFINKICH